MEEKRIVKELLTLPEAETYIFNFLDYKKSKKKIKDFLKLKLKEVHPGFSSESLWDYVIIKNGQNKQIKTVVLNKEFYLERKLRNPNLKFEIDDGAGGKKNVFSSLKYKADGAYRKKTKLFLLLIPAVLIAVILFVLFKPEKTVVEKQELQETGVVQIENVKNSLEIINSCCKVILDKGGKIKSTEYFSDEKNGKIKFFVTGCEPLSLIETLENESYIASCKCTDVVYENKKENFEIQIEFQIPQLYSDIQNEKELLLLQQQITDMIKQMNAVLLNARLGTEEGKLSFQISSERKNLKSVNEKLDELVIEKKLFITEFSELQNEDEFLINFEVIPLSGEQNLESVFEVEFLSEVYEGKERQTVKQKVVSKQKNQPSLKPAATEHLEKIGNVTKNGKEYFYYKNSDGKVYALENEIK